jgi:hypothetical protein
MMIPFGNGAYQHTSLPVSAQRMVNCYTEAAPPGSISPLVVVPSFGIKDFATLQSLQVASPGCRAAIVVNDVIFAVFGYTLYRIDPQSSIATALGDVPNTGHVVMAGDGKNIMAVCDGPGYIYDGNSVTQITDPSFPGAMWVAFLDGWMVVGPGNGTVHVNQTPYIPAVWNALDFASAEADPDDIVTGIVDHRELFLFGRESTEVWYDAGNVDFPLTRTASGYMEVGCSSRFGPAKIDNSVFFPAHDGTVRRVNGYTPVRVSTHVVEQAIRRYANQEARGMAWVENGHSFYGLTYDESTWVLDIATEKWAERASYGFPNWRATCPVRAKNQTFVGDSLGPRLGVLDADTFTEWGDPLVASCTAPAVFNENKPVQHQRLELMFETGVGTLSGQGSDPRVMLQWSDDSGRTWSNEHMRPLGKMGEFKSRAAWNRLGQSRNRVYRYAVSDAVRRTLVMALLDAA